MSLCSIKGLLCYSMILSICFMWIYVVKTTSFIVQENEKALKNRGGNKLLYQQSQQEPLKLNLSHPPEKLSFTETDFSLNNLTHGFYKTKIVESEKESIKEQSQIMAEHVKNSMKYFWNGYEKCAFGYDEVQPISCKGRNNWGGIGMTIVDSLDTLYIMDLKDEFNRCKDWIKKNLDFNSISKKLILFEINIRILGGLLSAYSLSKEEIFKEKAIDIGNRFYKSFESETFPYREITLSNSSGLGKNINAAEAGTFQLEYIYLSKISGDSKFKEKAKKSHEKLFTYAKDGFIPAKLGSGKVSFGSEGDSVYEYFLKTWILTGKTDNKLREMYDNSIFSLKTKLTQRCKSQFLYADSIIRSNRHDGIMEHLTCFVPGLIALDTYIHSTSKDEENLQYAKSLVYTCYQMYMRQKTHMAPESVKFGNGDMEVKFPYDILRPETVESLYILHEVTGDPIFLKWGWDIYKAFETATKTEFGYSGMKDVNKPNVFRDSTESFFAAETLKYLYLLFDTNHKINLKEYVFNTEAHPFKLD